MNLNIIGSHNGRIDYQRQTPSYSLDSLTVPAIRQHWIDKAQEWVNCDGGKVEVEETCGKLTWQIATLHPRS